jgi:hypothetical protein
MNRAGYIQVDINLCARQKTLFAKNILYPFPHPLLRLRNKAKHTTNTRFFGYQLRTRQFRKKRKCVKQTRHLSVKIVGKKRQ